MLMGWLFYRRTFSRRQVAGMAVSYAGVLLVFGHEVTLQGANVALGAFMVLASTVSFAIYLVYSGQLVQRVGALRLVGLATGFACILCIAQYFVLRPASQLLLVAPEVIWLSVLNASLCTAVPVLLVMMAIERIGPAMAAQSGMVGPISTILMGVLILGEPFTAIHAVN